MKRIAVIGAGGIAEGIHMLSLEEMKDVEVAAVCDIRPERAKKGAEKFGTKAYENYITMLDEIKPDGVLVLTQPDQAYRIARDSMLAGADVFCEKPAGLTMFQLESLKRTQEETGRILQIGFNRRYIPVVRAALDRLRKTGPITMVTGCFFKNGDASFYEGCGSSLECDVIHVADLLCAAAGSETETVYAFTDRFSSPVDNAWTAAIRYKNGALGSLRANYRTGGRTHMFEFHTESASAYINVGFGKAACEADVIYYGGVPSYSLASTGTVSNDIEHLDGLELSGSNDYHHYYGYFDELRAFIDSISSRVQSEATIGDAIRAMTLIDAIRESAASNNR